MRADFPEILLEHALPDLIFALLFADVPFWGSVKIDGLAYSIMVVQLILVQFVLVRIQVGQPHWTNQKLLWFVQFHFG